MFSQLYLTSCVQLWSFFAQVMPSGAPAAAPAATAAPAAPAVPAATAAAPAAAASGLPAAGTVPVSAPPAMPVDPTQIDKIVPPVQHSMALDVAHGIVLFLYFVICIGLILCVMFQTTKNEGGLSGVIGGTATTSLFRGKKSAEETLSLWTTRLAVAFIVFSMLIWLMFGRVAG